MLHKAMHSFSMVMGAVLLLAMTTMVAFATVTFDPSTGAGFVGKGDVQTAFGWNNATLQKNAGGVTFTYVSEATYEVTVEWDTGNPNSPHGITHHTITQTKTSGVNATIVYNARSHKQIDGFILTGFDDTTVIGDSIPAVGDVLVDPQSGNPYPTDHIVTAVTIITQSAGGLFVNYGGVSVPLPLITPVV